MNKSVDLARIRRALRGKQLLGFKLGPTSRTGRAQTGVNIGAAKVGIGKFGFTKT